MATLYQLPSGCPTGTPLDITVAGATFHTAGAGAGQTEHVYATIWNLSDDTATVNVEVSNVLLTKTFTIPAHGPGLMVLRGDAPMNSSVVTKMYASANNKLVATGYVIIQS